MIHLAGAHQQHHGARREQQCRDSRRELVERAGEKAVEVPRREGEQRRIHQPRDPQRQSERDERGPAHRILREPSAVVIQDGCRVEELTLRLRNREPAAAQENVCVPLLGHLVAGERLTGKGEMREKHGNDEHEAGGQHGKRPGRHTQETRFETRRQRVDARAKQHREQRAETVQTVQNGQIARSVCEARQTGEGPEVCVVWTVWTVWCASPRSAQR